MDVFDARILMRNDFDFEIKVFKRGIKKEKNRLHSITKRSGHMCWNFNIV